MKFTPIKSTLLGFLVFLITGLNAVHAQQVPDPDLGLRADWMRGSLGLLWLPENNYNGNIEGVSIEDFLTQIQHLKTVDFVQVGLASPYIYSPVHTAPHPLLERLWEGELGPDGKPINLVVPRASAPDPFLSWLKAIKAAGLKTEVYVNSANLLEWEAFGTPVSEFPDFSDRWKEYCDTDPTMKAFIESQPYHTDGVNDDRRPYMFCYAEFVLKEYAVRYGDLIDAWCFDAAHVNMGAAGDDYSTGDIDTQRVYQAFADACHAGNPDAAITFNNGIGDRDSDPFIPYVTPSLFEDYKFGHPFGGAGNMVEPRDPLYTVNFGICEYMRDTDGHPYTNDDIDWNDNVVAHFFPKQSTTSWNDGGTPCLTDEEFVEWNNVGLINGGGITWGTPLVITNLNNASPNLTLQPYALSQLELVDADLSVNQFPGAPNWARQYTILPDIIPGQDYSHTLIEGSDFWDPENVGITNLSIVEGGDAPDWLTITEIEEGIWVLGGTPTETSTTAYTFELRAEDADGGTKREVTLKVVENPNGFTNHEDGSPVWKVSPMVLDNTPVLEFFEYYLEEGVDFYDFEGDALSITISAGADWLNVEKLSEGIWYLSGTPELDYVGENTFTLMLNDGTHSTDNELQITVDPLDTSDGVVVEVRATPVTNYGIGAVATMISETQTATDGLATYKISVDVTPPSDKAVISGLSGGVATEYAWGLGDGTDENADDIFTGSDNEWVDNINNIQIIEFNSNGGTLTIDNITTAFESVTVVNAQSANDRVSFIVNDVRTDLGRLSTTPEVIYLTAAIGVENIQEFAIGTGNEATNNKWSIEGINVLVKFDESLSIDDNEHLALSFRLYPNPATDEISLNMPIRSARIMDITGKVVKVYNSETQNLDVSHLATGIYFLKGQSIEGVTLVKKFVKRN